MSHLTQEQRYIIDVLRKEKNSQTDIAERIGRDKSVVCRELQRNSDKRSGGYNGVWRPTVQAGQPRLFRLSAQRELFRFREDAGGCIARKRKEDQSA